jgi:hypothetical protein
MSGRRVLRLENAFERRVTRADHIIVMTEKTLEHPGEISGHPV